MAARSFCIPVTAPDGLTKALAAVRAEVSSPSAGLVFVSGALAQELEGVAEQVKAAWRNVPVTVVPAAGVLTERGEIEGASAVSGILWSGGKPAPFVIAEGGPPSALREALGSIAGQKSATALVFAKSDLEPESLEGISAVAPNLCVFGAGTVGGAALTLTATGEVLRGRASGLVLLGMAAPLVESSPACRLVTAMRPIEEVASGLVLGLGGSPALDVLSSCLPDLKNAGTQAQPQPVVFVALADPASPERFVVRPVRGIDPGRRGVMVGPEAKHGMLLGFAVRDAGASRSGLEAAARSISQAALGSAPRFALFLSCAGRGQGLYGALDVESRILRQRFGDLPIAGMHSAFEIVPWGRGEARIALYTGVLALFRSPS